MEFDGNGYELLYLLYARHLKIAAFFGDGMSRVLPRHWTGSTGNGLLHPDA